MSLPQQCRSRAPLRAGRRLLPPVQRPGLASAVYAAFGGSKQDWQGSSVAYAALAQNRLRSAGA